MILLGIEIELLILINLIDFIIIQSLNKNLFTISHYRFTF